MITQANELEYVLGNIEYDKFGAKDYRKKIAMYVEGLRKNKYE